VKIRIINSKFFNLSIALFQLIIISTCLAQERCKKIPNFKNENIELYNECIERYKKTLDINLWDKLNGDELDLKIDMVKKLEKKNDHIIVEEARNKKYLEGFLKDIDYIVDKMAYEKERKFSNNYIDKIQEFSESLTVYQNFIDERRQLQTALDNLQNQKQREHSLTEVFMQQISGIPTIHLIIGKSEWTTSMYDNENKIITSADVYNYISSKADLYIKNNLSSKLVYSEVKIENESIVKKIIYTLNNIKVDKHVADPYEHIDEQKRYILQKFKCYPNYNNQSEAINNSNNKNVDKYSGAIKKPDYEHVSYDFLQNLEKTKEFPKKLIDEAEKELIKVDEENRLSINKIKGFEQRYNGAMSKIKEKMNKNTKKMWEVTNTLFDRIYYDSGVNFNPNEISEKLNKSVKKLEEIDYDKIDEIKDLRHNLEAYLDKIQEKIENNKKGRDQDVKDMIEHKKIIVFTTQTKILGNNDDYEKEAIKILASAIDKLTERKKQLRSYELTVTEEGRLKSYKGKNYYNEGIPIKYLMFSPILKYTNKNENEQQMKLYFFLAWEVQYSQNSTQQELAIYNDTQNNIKWFIGKGECFPFEEAKKSLPKKFEFASRDYIKKFRNFLKKNNNIKAKHTYLNNPDKEFWTCDEDDDFFEGKIFTYDLIKDTIRSRTKTYCGYLIGIQ